jgi:hypothetical protein
VLGIVRAPEAGWSSSATLLAIGGGLALLVDFVGLQASRREPLMRLRIFRTPNPAAANMAPFLLGAAAVSRRGSRVAKRTQRRLCRDSSLGETPVAR